MLGLQEDRAFDGGVQEQEARSILRTVADESDGAIRRICVVAYAGSEDGFAGARKTFRPLPRPIELKVEHFLKNNCFSGFSQREQKAAAKQANGLGSHRRRRIERPRLFTLMTGASPKRPSSMVPRDDRSSKPTPVDRAWQPPRPSELGHRHDSWT